jgi:hypothetical protein
MKHQRHSVDHDDQSEYGGMIMVAWLLILGWAIFGLLIAWLCASGFDDALSWWIAFLQAYICYMWVSVALAGVLIMSIDHTRKERGE